MIFWFKIGINFLKKYILIPSSPKISINSLSISIWCVNPLITFFNSSNCSFKVLTFSLYSSKLNGHWRLSISSNFLLHWLISPLEFFNDNSSCDFLISIFLIIAIFASYSFFNALYASSSDFNLGITVFVNLSISSVNSFICFFACSPDNSEPHIGHKGLSFNWSNVFWIRFFSFSDTPRDLIVLEYAFVSGSTFVFSWSSIILSVATFIFFWFLEMIFFNSSIREITFALSFSLFVLKLAIYWVISVIYFLLSFICFSRAEDSVIFNFSSDCSRVLRLLTSLLISANTSILKIFSINSRFSQIGILKKGLLLVTATPTIFLNNFWLIPSNLSISAWLSFLEDNLSRTWSFL